ncbi:hypothetical protein ABZ545_18620 [Streptomyces abikoensis]|uniref:hypothetical protein n=1 Tax=Streptomyces abikoensis TaxID=97398 RepID=UPI003405CC90
MDLHRFLDQAGGVLALVSLTATVVWGLVAADRLALGPRGRLLAQAVHRALAIGALGFLLVHVGVKVAEAHASTTAALIPFASGIGGRAGLIGLGSLAGYLLVLAAATGVLRSVFAGRGRAAARRWRVLHASAYGAWCTALLHGLNAGREAAEWVTGCYVGCLVGVTLALVLRRFGVRVGRFAVRRRPVGAHAAGRMPQSRPFTVSWGSAPDPAPQTPEGLELPALEDITRRSA